MSIETPSTDGLPTDDGADSDAIRASHKLVGPMPPQQAFFDKQENRALSPRTEKFGEVADSLRALATLLNDKKILTENFVNTLENIFQNFNEYVGFQYNKLEEIYNILEDLKPEMTDDELKEMTNKISNAHLRAGNDAMINR